MWLLPFYASTERDNGYDVTGYLEVNPRYGTLDDFLEFVQKAGENGIRVILDLVVDHTSDKHPWFRAARYNRSSRYHNYFYWSEHPPVEQPGMGTLFPGEETGVWTFDHAAGLYYHHRFYHFQPSLNIHNPDVRDEIKRIIDYWMSYGISGFRIDAAGRMSEYPDHQVKVPEDTHQPLRDIFSHTKNLDPQAMLVGEADTTPDEVTAFMDGTQLDTCFNFFLNNHIFLAMASQSAEPIARSYDLLRFKLPNHASVNFLRNLDELDLSQITDAERQTIFDAFAPDEQMIIYGRGIRRRLAGMLNGNPDRLKLAYSLLFSLPGTPCVVYGDEIGMGDDLSLNGRDSVRTAMQWSSKRNAGFSQAPKSRIGRLPIENGRFGFHKVNVEMQLDKKGSLLEHVRRLAHLRRQLPLISESEFQPLATREASVLAHRFENEQFFLLHIHNLNANMAVVTLDLNLPDQTELCDLLTDFRCRVEQKKLKVKLKGYGYRWLSILF